MHPNAPYRRGWAFRLLPVVVGVAALLLAAKGHA